MAKDFFAVTKGHQTGIFDGGWDEARQHVEGFKGARFKGFVTRAEAERWFEENQTNEVERGGLVAYVDGSNTADGKAASYGLLIGEENTAGEITQVLYMEGGIVTQQILPEHVDLKEALAQRNILGEIIAALRAIRWVHQNGRRDLVIYHDYEGVGLWATGAFKARTFLTETYQMSAMSAMQYGLVKAFIHVKGHSGVAENEIADRLAGIPLGHDRIVHDPKTDRLTIEKNRKKLKVTRDIAVEVPPQPAPLPA
jgi:viroplasmin and RNaseH domain-containing protein